MKRFYFILALVFLQLIVIAQQNRIIHSADSFYVVDSKIQIHDLRPVTFVLADETNKLTLEEIASGKFNNKFQPVSSYKNFKDYTSYWLRLSIETRGNIKDWWLMLRDSTKNYYTSNTNAVQYNFVDVFFFNEKKQLSGQSRSGMFVPRSQKQIKNIAGISRVLFSGEQGEKKIVYIKIYSKLGGDAPAYLEIHNPEVALPAGGGDQLLAVQAGIVFVFSIFSFCLFFFVRDKSYLYFGIYTFVLTIIYLTIHSQLPFIDWLVPEHPQLRMSFELLNVAGIFIFFLLFGRSFINLPSLSKRTDYFLKVFIIVWCVFVSAEVIASAIYQEYLYVHYSDLTFTVLTFLFVIRFAFFKTIFSRLFIAGGLWLLCFSVLGILDNEFRTPLTLIQGPLQKIEEQVNGTSQNGFTEVPLRQIKTMRRHTDRLLELVNQLLDLSKLDSGKMKLQVIKGDVMQIIRVLATSFESMAERKQIHYYFHLPEQTSISFFDKDKLEKIVTNLLGNAF
ncbi:MAG TPA: sensor histidine kinase, partial [Chitinophagaceae bacterium]|nr:sensor histidine kinase [Chitinophagaceae bacterium]